mmetsp:Transcript_27527/g.52392  ORF Transcript_27527/g.52392 Transcript_27527/m.52392 type:complete len:356 (-) Transcript_27527:221-1288(-)
MARAASFTEAMVTMAQPWGTILPVILEACGLYSCTPLTSPTALKMLRTILSVSTAVFPNPDTKILFFGMRSALSSASDVLSSSPSDSVGALRLADSGSSLRANLPCFLSHCKYVPVHSTPIGFVHPSIVIVPFNSSADSASLEVANSTMARSPRFLFMLIPNNCTALMVPYSLKRSLTCSSVKPFGNRTTNTLASGGGLAIVELYLTLSLDLGNPCTALPLSCSIADAARSTDPMVKIAQPGGTLPEYFSASASNSLTSFTSPTASKTSRTPFSVMNAPLPNPQTNSVSFGVRMSASAMASGAAAAAESADAGGSAVASPVEAAGSASPGGSAFVSFCASSVVLPTTAPACSEDT